MKQTIKLCLTLLLIAGVSFAVLWGGDRLTRTLIAEQESVKAHEVFGELLNAKRFELLNTEGDDDITAAYRALDEQDALVGYGVTVQVAGYVDTIEVHVAVGTDKTRIKGIRIGKHRETAGYGARITSAVFLERFKGVEHPVYLAGGTTAMVDGVYRAVANEADSGGFRDVVELTVKGGKITAVNWDALNDAGVGKKELSRNGEYVMTETGLLWYQQAELLEQTLLRVQDPSAIVYDPQSGKTDAYSGASIRIDPFVKLAAQALADASGGETAGTSVDGLSGATASSKAVIAAVNTAARFIVGGTT